MGSRAWLSLCCLAVAASSSSGGGGGGAGGGGGGSSSSSSSSSADDATVGVLTIVAKYDNADGGVRELALRGSALGLNWTKGVVMSEGPRGTFTAQLPFAASDVGTLLEFKTLATFDTAWQMGGNSLATVAAGTATIFPWFETDAGGYFVAARNVPCKYFGNTRDVVV